MSAKKPYIVPIPGTRKVSRLEENMKASEIKLTKDEVKAIDEMLDSIPMSQVFGGSKIQKNSSLIFLQSRTFRTIMMAYPLSLSFTAVLIFILLIISRPSKRYAKNIKEKN